MSDASLAEQLQTADADTLHEIMRESEAHLSAQLSAAIAADQRAYTFAGMITAAAVLLIGASYALAVAQDPERWLSYTAVGIAACLFVSAWLAVISARAVDFEFAGNQPCHWVEHIAEGKPLLPAIAEQCAHYDEMLSSNTRLMNGNSTLFNLAVNIALGSVGVGGLAFVWWLKTTLS